MFTQVLALCSRQEFYRLVVEHTAERYSKIFKGVTDG